MNVTCDLCKKTLEVPEGADPISFCDELEFINDIEDNEERFMALQNLNL